MKLELQGLGLFPSEALVGAEVAELGRLVVDGPDEVELLRDSTRSQVEVGLHDLDQLVRGLAGGAI